MKHSFKEYVHKELLAGFGILTVDKSKTPIDERGAVWRVSGGWVHWLSNGINSGRSIYSKPTVYRWYFEGDDAREDFLYCKLSELIIRVTETRQRIAMEENTR